VNAGCGVGFLRGFQWSLVEYTTAQLRPYFLAMLLISLIQVGLLLVGVSVVCSVTRARTVGEVGCFHRRHTLR
jgi:hypothetical protein